MRTKPWQQGFTSFLSKNPIGLVLLGSLAWTVSIALCYIYVDFSDTDTSAITTEIDCLTKQCHTQSNSNLRLHPTCTNPNYFINSATYDQFNAYFLSIKFNLEHTKQNIENLNSYKMCFDLGFMWKLSDSQLPTSDRMAVVIIFIENDVYGKYNGNLWNDIRWKYYKMENVLNYCKFHGYDLIFITKPMIQFVDSATNKAHRMEYMNSPQFQKPFVIHQLFNQHQYEWILYTDFDTLFYDGCHKGSVDDIINVAYDSHPQLKKNKSISFIFSGTSESRMDSGVFLIKNSKFSQKLLTDLTHVIQHYKEYRIQWIKPHWIADWKLFEALLQGWDIDVMDQKHIEAKIDLFRDKDIEAWDPTDDDANTVNMEDRLDWIQDEYVKQYAVAIARHYIQFCEQMEEIDDIIIAHFGHLKMGSDMTKIFKFMKHSLEACPIDL